VFEGFALDEVDVGEVTLRVRHGGQGPPVVLLHGHPRTHATWHRVAPRLAPRHTVVCPAPPPEMMGAEAHADLWQALRDPAVVHGMCEDYRAGLRIDRAHEEVDRAAGNRISCPMLFLQAAHDDIDIHGDPVAIWRPWVSGGLTAAVIDSGHHQAEEAPGQLAAALLDFLA
jgi:pimeloyl-ACP methyl ester carboxylesterase